MRKVLRKRTMWATVAVALVAVLGITLLAQPADARRPIEPLCGPTILWTCHGGGDSVIFAGTVCEKEAFENETGLHCVPGV